MPIDRDSVQRGDTLQWTTRRNTPSFGLVEYTTDEGVHVEKAATGAGTSTYRYDIPWERVTGHWPGREHYDRARGALTDHAKP